MTFHKTTLPIPEFLQYFVSFFFHLFSRFLFFSLFLLLHKQRVVITVIVCSLGDMFVDYIYRRRNPRPCLVAIYRRMTNISLLVPVTRKPPFTKSYTYETYEVERLSIGHSMETERSPTILSALDGWRYDGWCDTVVGSLCYHCCYSLVDKKSEIVDAIAEPNGQKIRYFSRF